jgi:hypothetical protein
MLWFIPRRYVPGRANLGQTVIQAAPGRYRISVGRAGLKVPSISVPQGRPVPLGPAAMCTVDGVRQQAAAQEVAEQMRRGERADREREDAALQVVDGPRPAGR